MYEHYTTLLHEILVMQDSWQTFRLENFYRQEPTVGILPTIISLKAENPTKTYNLIKFVVNLFLKCKMAIIVLFENPELLTTWHTIVDWLEEQMKADQETLPAGSLRRTRSMPRIAEDARNLEVVLFKGEDPPKPAEDDN